QLGSSGEPVLPPPGAKSDAAASASVFVPSGRGAEPRFRRWPIYASALVMLAATVATAILVMWPRLNPRRLDPVERVANEYLKALSLDDSATIKRLGTVDEPPAIRS